MTCKYCNKEIKDNPNNTKKYCNDACRKAYSRRTNSPSSRTNVRDEQGGQTKSDRYTIVPDKKVYGRQAVSYGRESNEYTEWETRPMPENPEDVPVKGNRGIYKRKNGTKYLIDALGNINNR